jgi:hypothetical protein
VASDYSNYEGSFAEQGYQFDEISGAEKKTATNVLVQASDLRDAVKKLDEGMKGTMADYVIASIAETAIMDVYPYSAEPDVKPEFPDADKR